MQRKTPKAELKSDPLLEYQYGLARELGMTHKRLMLELGQGEIAYQVAYDERQRAAVNERDRRNEATRKAALAMQGMKLGARG